MRRITLLWTLAAAALVACSDGTAPSRTTGVDSTLQAQAEGLAAFQAYVAMGTSVSMGWQSDGLVAAAQYDSWPAQLSRLAGRELDQPYIDGTGCRAPLAPPLASGVRISGEPASQPAALAYCAPRKAGIDVPTRNVAMTGSTTYDAVYLTPETVKDPFAMKLWPRVFPPGETQLTSALMHNPKFISVELGANEVLGARTGVAIPGQTIFPVASWMPIYTALTDAVALKVGRGVLVGLIKDAATFPAFRRGAELFQERATFLAAFHVEVGTECEGSTNLLLVPVKVPTAIAAGLGNRARGLPPFVLTCADGGTTVQDFVLTPAEQGIINSTMAQMNAYIRATADRKKFAHFELEALYGMPGLKARFNPVQFMTSTQPYGPYISLDGLHPSGQGHAILAAAAARAINARYQLNIPVTSAVVAMR